MKRRNTVERWIADLFRTPELARAADNKDRWEPLSTTLPSSSTKMVSIRSIGVDWRNERRAR